MKDKEKQKTAKSQLRKETLIGAITLVVFVGLAILGTCTTLGHKRNTQLVFRQVENEIAGFQLADCSENQPLYIKQSELFRKHMSETGLLPWSVKSEAIVYHFLVEKMSRVCQANQLPDLPQDTSCETIVECRKKAEAFLLHKEIKLAQEACDNALSIDNQHHMQIMKRVVDRVDSLR